MDLSKVHRLMVLDWVDSLFQNTIKMADTYLHYCIEYQIPLAYSPVLFCYMKGYCYRWYSLKNTLYNSYIAERLELT